MRPDNPIEHDSATIPDLRDGDVFVTPGSVPARVSVGSAGHARALKDGESIPPTTRVIGRGRVLSIEGAICVLDREAGGAVPTIRGVLEKDVEKPRSMALAGPKASPKARFEIEGRRPPCRHCGCDAVVPLKAIQPGTLGCADACTECGALQGD